LIVMHLVEFLGDNNFSWKFSKIPFKPKSFKLSETTRSPSVNSLVNSSAPLFSASIWSVPLKHPPVKVIVSLKLSSSPLHCLVLGR
jgi:hypothetical protein